jgi:XTP/dITP diphosphohydrolase
MRTFVIATRNAHKVGEIRGILGGEFRFLTLADFPGAPETVEDAGSFAGNATKKSVELAAFLSGVASANGALVMADDSGLEVDALNGAPGVYSARFAALDSGAPGNSSTAENNAKLLRLLGDLPERKRTARFRCVIAVTPVLARDQHGASPVCYADERELRTEIFDGACEGRIGFAPSGALGFGYDPLFVPEGYDQTFAELGEDVKNRLSHRAKALAKLRRWLESRGAANR